MKTMLLLEVDPGRRSSDAGKVRFGLWKCDEYDGTKTGEALACGVGYPWEMKDAVKSAVDSLLSPAEEGASL